MGLTALGMADLLPRTLPHAHATHAATAGGGRAASLASRRILGDGGQCKFELGSTRSPQSETAKSQDALQVSEQHLDGLALTARSLESLGLGQRSRHVARLLIDAAQDLARRLLRTASRLERTRRGVARAGSIGEHLTVPDLAGALHPNCASRMGLRHRLRALRPATPGFCPFSIATIGISRTR